MSYVPLMSMRTDSSPAETGVEAPASIEAARAYMA